MGDELKKQIREIHDFMIRLEPICEMVKKHDKSLYNNGFGLSAQVKVLWALAGGVWTITLLYIGKII